MSSILRALKKLENSPFEEKGLLSWHREIDVKKSVGGAGRRPQLRSGIWFGLPLIALLLGVGWLFFKYYADPARKPTGSRFVYRQMKKEELNRKDSPAGSSAGIEAARTGSKSQPADSPPRLLEKKRQKAFLDSAPGHPESGSTVLSRDKYSASHPGSGKTDNSGNAAKIGSSSTIPDMTDSRFKVQAIAWSSIPAKRFAVINERIVHEGDAIEGVIVTRIGLDDVSLAKGGKELKLRFNRRR